MAVVSVIDARTWRPLGDGGMAPQVIEVPAIAHDVVVAMDFDGVLNANDKISSVSAVSVVSGTSLTIGTLTVGSGNRVAHATITCTTTTGQRIVRWTVVSSDNATYYAEGRLNLTNLV